MELLSKSRLRASVHSFSIFRACLWKVCSFDKPRDLDQIERRGDLDLDLDPHSCCHKRFSHCPAYYSDLSMPTQKGNRFSSIQRWSMLRSRSTRSSCHNQTSHTADLESEQSRPASLILDKELNPTNHTHNRSRSSRQLLPKSVPHFLNNTSIPKSISYRCLSMLSLSTSYSKQNSKNSLLYPKVLLNERLYSESTKDDENKDIADVLKDLQADKETLKADLDVKGILDEIKSDFQDNSHKNVKSDSSSDSDSSSSSDDEGSVKDKNSNSLKPEKAAYDEEFIYDYRYADDIEDFGYADSEYVEEDRKPEKIVPIPITRGKEGVFDLDELLTFLDHLGAENVVTVPVSSDANYCSHMVVSSAKSMRHLQYITDEFLWILIQNQSYTIEHKRKKESSDPHLHIEGLDRSDWCAMDMGNIVLHVFYGNMREFYDIESLWTLGPENDPKCQELGHDPYALSEEDLFWLESSKIQEKVGNSTTTDNDENPPSGLSAGKDLSNSQQEDEAGWHDPKSTPV